MDIQELEEKIEKKKQSMTMGFKDDNLSFKIWRNCQGERVQIARGIYGRIVQWGGRTDWTIFMLKLADAEKLLAMMKKAS